MIVHFEDQEYKLDIEEMDLAQARTIKRQTGLSVRGLMQGLEDFDPEALVALYWLMRAQNGKAVDMHKVNFPLFKFADAIAAAAEAEAENEAEADPTNAAPGPAPEKS